MMYLKTRRCLQKATTTITGPNDVRRVVCASYHRRCLLQASPCLQIHHKYLYISINTEKTCRKKNFTHLGPRRRETRHLGTFDSAPTLVVVVVELWWWWWCCCCTVVAVFVVVVVVVVEVWTECLVDVCMHINKVT